MGQVNNANSPEGKFKTQGKGVSPPRKYFWQYENSVLELQ